MLNWLIALFNNPKAVNHVVREHRRIFPELYGYDGVPNPDYITDIILKKYFGGNFSTESVKEFSKVRKYYHKSYQNCLLDYKVPQNFNQNLKFAPLD